MKAVDADPWETADQDFSDGQSYQGRVTRLENFGAFVEIAPGIEGLIHISEMSWEKRIMHPSEVVKVGDTVNVRILSINMETRKISLSLKNIEDDPWHDIESRLPIDSVTTGTVESLKGFGAIISLARGLSGLLPMGVLKEAYGETYRKKASPPKEIEVRILKIDRDEQKILLSLPNIDDKSAEQADFREYMNAKKSKPVDQKSQKTRGSFGDILAAKLNQSNK